MVFSLGRGRGLSFPRHSIKVPGTETPVWIGILLMGSLVVAD